MTPLEEIEQAINVIRDHPKTRLVDREDVLALKLLAALYQARAIERLEATVRAIGVMFQRVYDEAKGGE